MHLILRLAVSLTLVCPAFAYQEKKSPAALDAQSVQYLVSTVKSMGQMFKILEMFAKPGEYEQVKKYLNGMGITEKTALPKMTVTGTKITVEGVKGEFDFKYLTGGKIDNGRSVMTISHQRGMIENLKAVADYVRTGSYRASAFDLLFPRAAAEDISTAGAAASLVFTVFGFAVIAVAAIGAVGSLAIPGAIAGGVAVLGGALMLLGQYLYSTFSQMAGNVYVKCEDNELIVMRRAGFVDESLFAQDYLGKLHYEVWKSICEETVLAQFNELLSKLTPAQLKKLFGKGTETKK